MADHSSFLLLLLLTFLLSCQYVAAAEDDVLTPYVSYSMSYDDNLLRVSNPADAKLFFGTEQTGDTIKRTAVGINIDKQLGRQDINIKLEMSRNKFNRFTTLDNDGKNLSGQWHWQLGDHLEGNLRATYTSSLGTFMELRQLLKNDRVQSLTFADIAWRFHPTWKIRAATSVNDYENSAASEQIKDQHKSTLELGVDYLPSSGNKIGLQLTRIAGDYPNRVISPSSLFDKSYVQNELSTVADWQLTGKSSIKLKLGITNRSYDLHPNRNFTGPTGRVTLEWRPTAKLACIFSSWRDIYAVEEVSSSYVDGRGVSLTPTWNITSKLSMQAKLSYEEQSHTGEPIVVINAPLRQDTLQSAMLMISYSPLKNAQLSVSAQHDERRSNQSQLDFVDNTMMATAAYSF